MITRSKLRNPNTLRAGRSSKSYHDPVLVEDETDEKSKLRKLIASKTFTSKRTAKWWQRGYLHYYHIRDIPRYMQDNPWIFTG